MKARMCGKNTADMDAPAKNPCPYNRVTKHIENSVYRCKYCRLPKETK